nr:MAG TPA: hypothetical protein [Caudoviricetes sp.]
MLVLKLLLFSHLRFCSSAKVVEMACIFGVC